VDGFSRPKNGAFKPWAPGEEFLYFQKALSSGQDFWNSLPVLRQ